MSIDVLIGQWRQRKV